MHSLNVAEVGKRKVWNLVVFEEEKSTDDEVFTGAIQ
jgi:hypothetical protein